MMTSEVRIHKETVDCTISAPTQGWTSVWGRHHWSTLCTGRLFSNTPQWASDTQSRTRPCSADRPPFYSNCRHAVTGCRRWDRRGWRDTQWPLPPPPVWWAGRSAVFLVTLRWRASVCSNTYSTIHWFLWSWLCDGPSGCIGSFPPQTIYIQHTDVVKDTEIVFLYHHYIRVHSISRHIVLVRHLLIWCHPWEHWSSWLPPLLQGSEEAFYKHPHEARRL